MSPENPWGKWASANENARVVQALKAMAELLLANPQRKDMKKINAWYMIVHENGSPEQRSKSVVLLAKLVDRIPRK